MTKTKRTPEDEKILLRQLSDGGGIEIWRSNDPLCQFPWRAEVHGTGMDFTHTAETPEEALRLALDAIIEREKGDRHLVDGSSISDELEPEIREPAEGPEVPTVGELLMEQEELGLPFSVEGFNPDYGA